MSSSPPGGTLLAERAIGQTLLTAWIAKGNLRSLLALALTGAGRRRIGQARWKFLAWCADAGIPEVRQLAATIDCWWPEIEAFIHTGHGNARSEGVSRVIKPVARSVRLLDYSVEYGAAPDGPQLAPAMERVTRRTGRVPRAVTADRGYGYPAIERDLHDLGITTVATPRQRGYGWDRTRLDGKAGAAIWCGHGVFAHNLVKISTLAS